MKISEVNIQFIKPDDGLVAFASVVLDESLYLGSIGIHERLDGAGYRLTYPTKKSGVRQFHLFHPINKALSQQIEKAVFQKFTELLKLSEKKNISDEREG